MSVYEVLFILGCLSSFPLLSDPGLDASPPASTHELTIPNDVSIKIDAQFWLPVLCQKIQK